MERTSFSRAQLAEEVCSRCEFNGLSLEDGKLCPRTTQTQLREDRKVAVKARRVEVRAVITEVSELTIGNTFSGLIAFTGRVALNCALQKRNYELLAEANTPADISFSPNITFDVTELIDQAFSRRLQ